MEEESGELYAVFNNKLQVGRSGFEPRKQCSLSAGDQCDMGDRLHILCVHCLGISVAQVWLLRTSDSKALCMSQGSLSKADCYK